jgi:hypothetical protein
MRERFAVEVWSPAWRRSPSRVWCTGPRPPWPPLLPVILRISLSDALVSGLSGVAVVGLELLTLAFAETELRPGFDPVEVVATSGALVLFEHGRLPGLRPVQSAPCAAAG